MMNDATIQGWVNPNEAYWINRDHDEALSIDRQLDVSPDGTTVQHIIDLNSFSDCADDGEGYSVPAERMRSLKAAGLVEGGRFGRYSLSDAGQLVRRAWYHPQDNAKEQSRGR